MRTYTLDFALHREVLLNANQRLHWAPRRSRTKNLRFQGYAAARNAGVRPLPAAQVTVYVTYPDRRRRDVHNLMPTVKALVDGLVDAKVLPDDSDEYLSGPDLRATGEISGTADVVRLRVVITEQLSRSVREAIATNAARRPVVPAGAGDYVSGYVQPPTATEVTS